jgi:hypothetical protein
VPDRPAGLDVRSQRLDAGLTALACRMVGDPSGSVSDLGAE